MARKKKADAVIETITEYEAKCNFMWNDKYITRGTKGTFEPDFKELLKKGFIK